MHPHFLDLLCCPHTCAPLALEAREMRPNGMVATGALVAADGTRYPIVRGIPRFVDAQHYAASFGYEWTRWPRVQFELENAGRPMAGHTKRMWHAITLAAAEQVCDRTIVEFGCGPGRFLDVVRSLGGRAVGIDLSQAVEAARHNFADDPDVLIIQGDILTPPLRPGVLDGGYSIGVLHHTPDPQRGLQALARTVRRGGWVACCVYQKDTFYDWPSVRRFRWLHNRLCKPLVGYRAALLYSHASAYALEPLLRPLLRIRGVRRALMYVERNWIVTLHLPDARWRLLDIFDAITPEVATTHTWDELRAWMEAAGCAPVTQSHWGETSAVGIKGIAEFGLQSSDAKQRSDARPDDRNPHRPPNPHSAFHNPKSA